MKTFDDALKTPGVIPDGRYRMEEGFDVFSHIGGDKNEARLKGRFVPDELRRIANHLDPQPDHAEARREALELAAKVAASIGRPAGASDGGTYIPGTSAEAAAAIRALMA